MGFARSIGLVSQKCQDLVVLVPGRATGERKLPHLFLIDDLLAEKQKPPDAKARKEDIPIPVRT